jgi:hypothetical protein
LAVAALPALAGEPATETRTLHQTFAVGTETLRLANLCGRVELVPGKGKEVVVDAVLHAAGSNAAETQKLLGSLRWIETKDRKGRPQWALSYPVDDYRGFAYPRKGGTHGGEWFGDWLGEGRSTLEYRGERVAVYGAPRSGAPVLYADLRIEIPDESDVAVRNGVGSVRGGALRGTLVVDTASGDVEIASYFGGLSIDTGSGDVDLGDVDSKNLSVDTGSGSVRVDALRGGGVIDTGSGDVEVLAFHGADLSIDTGSGDVRVGGGEAVTLSVDTGSGDIRIDNVELESFRGDTGSGDVILRSSLERTRDVVVDTGSGEVKIFAGPMASFDLEADQGSGEIVVGYADASFKTRGREIYGARRGDGKTRIRVETGSGDCEIHPQPHS